MSSASSAVSVASISYQQYGHSPLRPTTAGSSHPLRSRRTTAQRLCLGAVLLEDRRARSRAEGGPWASSSFSKDAISTASPVVQDLCASASFNPPVFRQRYRSRIFSRRSCDAGSHGGGHVFGFEAPTIVSAPRALCAAASRRGAWRCSAIGGVRGRVLGARSCALCLRAGRRASPSPPAGPRCHVLVADSAAHQRLLRDAFSREGGTLQAEPLGHARHRIAGDTFDYRIVDHVVSPRLGKGSSYRFVRQGAADPNRYYTNRRVHHSR